MKFTHFKSMSPECDSGSRPIKDLSPMLAILVPRVHRFSKPAEQMLRNYGLWERKRDEATWDEADKMAAEKKVKGILFDFDNTLVPTRLANKHALDKIIEILAQYYTQKDAEQIAQKYKNLILLKPSDPTGRIKPDIWRIGLLERLLKAKGNLSTKYKPSPTELYNIWNETRQEKLVIDEETTALLQELKTYYRVGVVTNGDSTIQREKLTKAGVYPLIQTIVIGGEQPKPKPYPSIFQTACALLNVPPHNCVVVGDNLHTDIQGGLNLGVLATVWVNYNFRKIKHTDPKPHYIINSVLELPKVLEKLSKQKITSF